MLAVKWAPFPCDLGNLMRIIAGKWRSRRLVRPPSPTTRPMPDRVREAMFDMLGSYYDTPGMLPPLDVADVFAGSGSMGLEALSRGASSCCFFERDRGALHILKRNLDVLGVGPEATVVARDAWKEAVTMRDGRPFGLVFLDPPYADSEDTSDAGAVRQYLGRLRPPDGNKLVVVLHHPARAQYSTEGEDAWSILKQRTFGGNGVTFFKL